MKAPATDFVRLRTLLLGMTLAVGGCTTYGVVENVPVTPDHHGPVYALSEFVKNPNRRSDELMLAVAFSGDGTRAAALSYGVLQELRDTQVKMNGQSKSLLDTIDVISSVSGGSFTSPCYGLYGNRIFVDYEERFLRSDVEGAPLRGLLDPARWFSSDSRTEMAVTYYKQAFFGDATFGDLIKRDGPLILINRSDLSSGGRFSFVQDRHHLGQRGGRLARRGRRQHSRAKSREDDERRRHASADTTEPRPLDSRTIDARTDREFVLHPAELRGRARSSVAPLPQ